MKGLSHTYIHVPVHPQIPLPSRLPHNIEKSSMCYTIGLCWLSILNIAETHFFLIRKRNWLLMEEGRKYKLVWYLWCARCCNRTPQSQKYYLYLGKILFSEVEVSLWSTALVVCRTGTRKGSDDIWHTCSITVTHLIMRPLFDP